MMMMMMNERNNSVLQPIAGLERNHIGLKVKKNIHASK